MVSTFQSSYCCGLFGDVAEGLIAPDCKSGEPNSLLATSVPWVGIPPSPFPSFILPGAPTSVFMCIRVCHGVTNLRQVNLRCQSNYNRVYQAEVDNPNLKSFCPSGFMHPNAQIIQRSLLSTLRRNLRKLVTIRDIPTTPK